MLSIDINDVIRYDTEWWQMLNVTVKDQDIGYLYSDYKIYCIHIKTNLDDNI